jgi:hypothetical protein
MRKTRCSFDGYELAQIQKMLKQSGNRNMQLKRGRIRHHQVSKKIFRLLVIPLFIILPARAQNTPDICRDIAANNARLTCYDKSFGISKPAEINGSVKMTMSDFLTDYRDMGGETVTITANMIQTGNMVFLGADTPPILNYAIVSIDKVDREARRKINKDCSNVLAPICEVTIIATVSKDKSLPRLVAKQIIFN